VSVFCLEANFTIVLTGRNACRARLPN